MKQLLTYRRALLFSIYAAGLSASLWISYQLRFDFSLPPDYSRRFTQALPCLLLIQFVLLSRFKQFTGLFRDFSVPDLARLSTSLGLATALALTFRSLAPEILLPPRSILLLDLAFSLITLGGIRLGVRLLWERRYLNSNPRPAQARRIAIIGAGHAGSILAKELLAKRNLGLRPVAFFDDDPATWHSCIHGVPVAGSPELLTKLQLPRNKPTSRLARFFHAKPPCFPTDIDELIIAMPSAPAKRIAEILKIADTAGLTCRTVPSLDQLATGAVTVTQLRRVEVQDLLGRPPIQIESENIRSALRGKIVLVTGAAGSIGSELCRQILRYHPARLLLVEQAEPSLFQIEQELLAAMPGCPIVPCIANVLDSDRIREIFETHHPEIVFHAAAHKHVPLMESHPGEAIKNNTFGTVTLANLSLRFGVDRFVLISTDKAINPTNVMGATKRLSEMYIQSLYASCRHLTKFMAVRFGNVLGSSGSVIPTFAKQIAAGGPVKVTHPAITRYFMTIPEAASLVLQSCAQGSGGEIFVLDMGEPVRILDLARQMIQLSGLRPGADIEIQITGLRPGEKLYEELCYKGENITPTLHPKIMRFVSTLPSISNVTCLLEKLSEKLHSATAQELKLLLKEAVPEYQPYLNSSPPQEISARKPRLPATLAATSFSPLPAAPSLIYFSNSQFSQFFA